MSKPKKKSQKAPAKRAAKRAREWVVWAAVYSNGEPVRVTGRLTRKLAKEASEMFFANGYRIRRFIMREVGR